MSGLSLIHIFAAAGGAYDGNALAGLHVQREPLDERAVGQLAERNILQLHMAVRLQRGGVFSLRHLILGVPQFKHPGGAGQCVLQLEMCIRDRANSTPTQNRIRPSSMTSLKKVLSLFFRPGFAKA